MRSKDPKSRTGELYKTRLDFLLDQQHALFLLADRINWETFETAFGPLYSEDTGRVALPIRLLVGLHYLKHLFDVSDERVVEVFVENPYWQYFCGCEYFVHELPCHPTTLVKWRQRVGAEKMETLLKATVEAARASGELSEKDLEKVAADTTVQEKAIAFPTDARLLWKARRRLVRIARRAGIRLRQTFERVGKKALFRQSQYARARQIKRARAETRTLKTQLGRVIRNVERVVEKPQGALAVALDQAKRIHAQKRDDSNKLYSLHATEVECIAKGKAHKRYEFGCKVGIATTLDSNWVVAITAFHGNPYDGATLKPLIEQVNRMTGVIPKVVSVDRGFRGQAHHPKEVEVILPKKSKPKGTLRRLLHRRSAIEPVIGHVKIDHRMQRNHLLGKTGDAINAILCGAAFNLRKLLRVFFLFVFRWLGTASQPWVQVTQG
jgi:IS5 family transposase